MIIVNQERTKIINFEKITEIIASGTKILVGDDILIPKGEEIAKYETEERAKEVLQEIVKQKAIFEFFKNVPERTQILLANDFKEDNEIFDTYEMPEK